MNRFMCWLFGHEYVGAARLRADESIHESVLSLERKCLCCDGVALHVSVNPDRAAGSRYVWSRAHALVSRSEGLERPVWLR